MKTFIFSTALILTAILIWTATPRHLRTTTKDLLHRPIRTTETLPRTRERTDRTDPTPQAFYQTIIDNNLFRPLGWRQPVHRPHYQLIATITGTDPQALILDKNTNKLHSLATGEKLGESTLTEIKDKHVTLRKNEQNQTLRIRTIFLR